MGFIVEVEKNGMILSSKFPWKIGIVLFMAYPSLQKSEEELERALSFLTIDKFFDRLETSKISEDGWKIFEKYARKRNIARAFQPEILSGKNISATDETKRMEAVNYIKSEINIWVKRGVCEFALCSGPREQNLEKCRKNLKKSLEEIAEYASQYGAAIFLETFDIDKDKKLVMGPIDEAAGLVRELRESYNNVFLMWDQSHAPLINEKPELLEKHVDILGEIHIGCAIQTKEGLKDWHPVYHTPGAINDEYDLSRLLRKLYEIKYCGPISVEIKPQEGQTSEEVINSAKGAVYAAYSLTVESII
jgi:sugar phosphate isomerase/epimerase